MGLLFGMWKDFPTFDGKGGSGSLICDTMSMCNPSRGLTTGFQASLQHLKNNLIVTRGWVRTPDKELVVWCSIHWATVMR